jgi:hypothetical protein
LVSHRFWIIRALSKMDAFFLVSAKFRYFCPCNYWKTNNDGETDAMTSEETRFWPLHIHFSRFSIQDSWSGLNGGGATIE